jgi:hypothetical protein
MYVSHQTLRHLDELARADLQALRDSYFEWLLIATWAVLIGVAMEGPEVAKDLMDGFERSRGREEKRHPLWVSILSSVGWLLIVGGIVGEGIFEAMVSSADGSLQTFNDILLASAGDRASAADERVAIVNSNTKSLGIDLEAEKQKTARAQADLADAQRKLVAVLQREMLTRNVDPDAIERLKNFPKATATVLFKALDGEAAWFAERVRVALLAAGWNVPELASPVVADPRVPGDSGLMGIRVYMRGPLVTLREKVLTHRPKPGEVDTRFSALMFLLSNGFGTWQTTEVPDLPENSFTILIGQRYMNLGDPARDRP